MWFEVAPPLDRSADALDGLTAGCAHIIETSTESYRHRTSRTRRRNRRDD
jgi:hypothetical protein